MYKKLMMIAIAACLSLIGGISVAGEPVDISYQYQGSTGVKLAAIVGGPLTINNFTDQRNEPETQDIQRPGMDPITLAELAPHRLVQSALTSAFESSGASLGESESPLILDGKLIEMKIQDTDAGLEVLIRCELSLRNQGRNAWQSVVFSRAIVEGKDISSAIGLGLDKLIAELFRDDYFLMELGVL